MRRQRKGHDDKLLFMHALQLQPVPAAAARILTGSAFGDDALRMQFTRSLEHLAAAAHDMFAESQKLVRTLRDLSKQVLTLIQRQFPDRMPIQVKKVEEQISKGRLLAFLER